MTVAIVGVVIGFLVATAFLYFRWSGVRVREQPTLGPLSFLWESLGIFFAVGGAVWLTGFLIGL